MKAETTIVATESAPAYGGRLDPVADKIFTALKNDDCGGLSRTDIRDLFCRNVAAARIDAALAALQTAGLAESVRRYSGGRPTAVWTLKMRERVTCNAASEKIETTAKMPAESTEIVANCEISENPGGICPLA